jgi:hypothetical protein
MIIHPLLVRHADLITRQRKDYKQMMKILNLILTNNNEMVYFRF